MPTGAGCQPARSRVGRVRGRVVALSASVGAGHDGATSELARRLRARGFAVDQYDFMAMLPGRLGARAISAHNIVLRRAPWVYGGLFAIGRRFAVTAPITRALLYPVRRRLLGVLTGEERAVVSTFPLASQVLGPLRRTGRLSAPAITVLTDFAIHRHWIAPGVDAHIAPHHQAAAAALALGGGGIRVAGPLVSPAYRRTSLDKQEARERCGLPAGRLALVVAGSWGVGEVEQTVADITRLGVATPVVVCGANTALRQRLRDGGVRYALGWVDDMPTLMRAVDVLVENAGGLTAVEAMACGLAVLTYRPIPGHGTDNAGALDRAGVATWARSAAALGAAIRELADASPGDRQRRAAGLLFGADAAEAIAQIVAASSVPRPAMPRRVAPPLRSGPRNRRVAALWAGAGLGALVAMTLSRRGRPRRTSR